MVYPTLGYIGGKAVVKCHENEISLEATKTYADVIALSSRIEAAECRRRNWILVEHDVQPGFELKAALRQLVVQNDSSRAFCMGKLCKEGVDIFLTLVKKNDKGALTDEHMTLNGKTPTAYYVPKHGPPATIRTRMATFVQTFSASLSSAATNFLVGVDDVFDMPRMMHITQGLSDTKFEVIVGNANGTPKKERTAFQTALLMMVSNIRALRKSSMIQHDMPVTCEWKHFQNLDQLCYRFNETLGQTVSVTLLQYLQDSELHLHHALVILGSNATSGWGKSQLCFTFVSKVAAGLSLFRGEVVRPIMTRTLDELRSYTAQMEQGAPIVFDDTKFSDSAQIQYMSDDMLKCCLDVRAGGAVRTRNVNVRFRPQQVRVWSANADSIEEFFCGDGERVPKVVETALRRVWILNLKKPLITRDGIAHLKAKTIETNAGMAAVMKPFLPQ